MIKNIKKVAAFAHRDNSNAYSNILIKDGMMTAQNDLNGISIKGDSELEFCCNADRLSKSLSLCDESKMKMSIKNKRLYIVSGRFKSNIPLTDIDSYYLPDFDGAFTSCQSDIINQLSSISQFTDVNNVRVALQGVEISSNAIKATNGHMAVVKNIDEIGDIEPVIIPTKSIMSMVKVNADVNAIMVKGKSVYFNLDEGILFTKTIDQKMPDIERIITKMENIIDLTLLKDPIKSLASMCSDDVMILGETISNRKGDASMDGFTLPDCAFNVNYLLKIMDVADSIDFSQHPKACPFIGDNIRGAVAGLRG